MSGRLQGAVRRARAGQVVQAVLCCALAVLAPADAPAQTRGVDGAGYGAASPSTGSEVLPELFDDGVRGQLRPLRHTILAAGIAGQIGAFPVDLGGRVEVGQPLVEMVCDELEAAFAVAAARVEAAAARYTVSRRLDVANNISGLEVDLSRAELTVARAEQERIAAQRAYCRIDAPFSGVVADKLVQAHQHVTAGTPLLELVDNSELEVEVAVPSSWLSRVSPGAGFEMTLDETGQVLHGEFVRTVGRVDPVSQTLRVIGRLIEPPSGLLTGMSGRLSLLPE